MAKLNLEIEVDWIDEESNLDETVKESVMLRIEKAVVEKIQAKVLKDSEKRINEQVDALVTGVIKDKIEQFLNTPRNVTDKYGEVIKENVTVEGLLKERMENAMTQRTLDENGKASSYNSKYSIFEFFAGKNMNRIVSERVMALANDTKKEIEQMVSTQIKANIADKLTNMILDNSTALSLKSERK